MTELLGVLGIVAALAWTIRRVRDARADRRTPLSRHTHLRDDGIDHAELEAAEREVRDLDAGAREEDGFVGDDWGPGASGRPMGDRP